MKNNKGFSLVELIVVIAIMAILAAVAVIGVSVYIPHAQDQADVELCGVLTDALRAACLNYGVNSEEVKAEIKVNSDGSLERTAAGAVKINIVDKQGNKLANDAEIVALFNEIVNAKDAFKRVTSGYVSYSPNPENNNRLEFHPVTSSNLPVSYKGFTTTQEKIDAYINSVFNNVKTEDLLSNVNSIIKQADGKVNPLEVAGFETFYTKVLGKTFTDPSVDPDKSKMMDALVLYAAYISSQDDVDMDMFEDHILGTGVDKTDENGKTSENFLAAEAMKYAVGMAWIRELKTKVGTDYKLSSGAYGDIQPEDYKAVTTAMSIGSVSIVKSFQYAEPYDPAIDELCTFSNWYEINGEDAVAGYMAAMGMIDENNSKVEVGNGYGDYADIINGLLGKN